MTRAAELKAIEDAIKAGRLRRFAMGETTEWDDKPYKERRSAAINARRKMICKDENERVP